MHKLIFNDMWISRIITCVSIVSYSILVNGQPSSVFQPTRGLDSIFPYLYLICAKGFSTLLNETENTHRIRGVKMARSNPSINYLLFTDDSIIFCWAKLKE